MSQDQKTIVIAEDDRLTREALVRRLERWGFRVLAAVNGEQAISACRNHRPDLVLMDIEMPKMGGLEAVAILMGEEQLAAIPVIAMTADHGTREIALDTGCVEHVTKPLDLGALLLTLRHHLQIP